MRARFLKHARQVAVIVRHEGDRGMSTAEYAVGTIAACGFAALLYKIVTSSEIQALLTDLINRALSVGS